MDVVDVNTKSLILAILAVLMMLSAGLFPMIGALGPRGPVANTDSEPNNVKADATTVDTAGKITGTLIGADHYDNYKFRLDRTGGSAEAATIDVVFDLKSPLVSVYLRDANGFLLDFSRDQNTTTLRVIATMLPDWFYLNITDDTLNGITYNVTFSFTTVTDTLDANNNPAEAVAVGSFPYSINTTADGDTEPMDRQDLYKVSLSRTVSKADLLVAQMTQDITAQFWVEVFDSSFKPVLPFEKQAPSKPGSTQVCSYGTTAAGIYYIRVWAAAGEGHYTLNIDRIEIDLNDNNDKAANATAISLINNHTATASGNVGEGLDLSDFYSLPVVKGQVLNVTITSTNYNASTQLPKMHLTYLRSDGSTQWDVDPNMTDNQLDPIGYTNASASEAGPVTNYIKIFVDNVASGGGAYTLDIFTDRPPVANQSLIYPININESTLDKPTSDTSIKLSELFNDPDGNDVLAFSYFIVSDQGMADSANLTVGIGKDLGSTVTISPKPGGAGQSGWKGSGEITFIATNNFGMNASATFPVKVTGTNHAPYVKSPYNATYEIKDPLTLLYTDSTLKDLDLRTVFGDIDTNDKLTYDVNGTSPAIEVKSYGQNSVDKTYFLKSATINDTFILSPNFKTNLVDHTGIMTIRLNVDSDKVKKAKEDRVVLEEPIWFSAHDNGLPSKWCDNKVKMLIRAISPNGTPPKWSQSLIEIVFPEDGNLTLDLDTVTSDIDQDDAKARTYTVGDTGPNVTVTKVDRSKFKFSAKKDWSGLVAGVTLNCTDTFKLYKTHTVDIRVTAVPDPPVKDAASPQEGTTLTMNEGASQAFGITVHDVDSNILKDLEYNWSLDGSQLRTIVGPNFTYQPDFDEAGTHTILIVVSERANPELKVNASWTVVVVDVNRQPTGLNMVSPENGGTYKEKAVIPLMASTATDPDKGDVVTYKWLVDGRIVATSQTFDLTTLKKGTYNITLQISDGEVTLSQSATITVKAKTVKQDMNMNYVVAGLVVLVVIILVAAFALRGKKVEPQEEKVDIYAADKAAKKKGLKGKKTTIERIEEETPKPTRKEESPKDKDDEEEEDSA